MTTLFISEKELVANSILNENVSYALVRPTLLKTQELKIQPILGSPLYKEMAGQIASGTLTALNATLLQDYIQPALIQWVMHEMPMVLAFKYMNKNMVRRESQESSNMSMDEIQRLMDAVKNDAEWYSERITRYLEENRTKYPLFLNPTVAIDTIYPNKRNYTTGMVLSRNTRPKSWGLDMPPSMRYGIYGDCNDC